jgi:hypothetical protein
VQDTGPGGTSAKVLAGTNFNPVADPSGRQFANEITTGWIAAKSNTVSDIFRLWGMTSILGSEQTDTYVLSLSYTGGAPVLATSDQSGNWINAVDNNVGGSKKAVQGPYQDGYALGSYGVDAASKTVWAVLNYNGWFAAVSGI